MPLHKKGLLILLLQLSLLENRITLGVRFPDRAASISSKEEKEKHLSVAVFALGSFWRSEAVFGCLPGVIRSSVGYAGGSKSNPQFRSLGDHAECVKIDYDPKVIHFKQLLDVFWLSHDSRQVFGQGPDVGNQYRSIIFTNGTLEARMAASSKEREQTKSKSSVVTTEIQQLGTFYPAENEHQMTQLLFKYEELLTEVRSNSIGGERQNREGYGRREEEMYSSSNGLAKMKLQLAKFHGKEDPVAWLRSAERFLEFHRVGLEEGLMAVTFHLEDEANHWFEALKMVEANITWKKFELKRNKFLLQLIGNMPEEELQTSNLATKLNGYAAELCPPRIQKQIDAKIDEILEAGWPLLRDL